MRGRAFEVAATLPVVEILTSQGAARAEIEWPAGAGPGGQPPFFLLALTHGAGGTPYSPDLDAAAAAGLSLGGVVARVTQPYRVSGRRAPGSAARQDQAWLEVIAQLRAGVAGPGALGGAPAPGALVLVQGGRSNGARVACRTAREAGAAGVVALAFPLHPPGRPERSREAELRQAGTAVLVVNGERDPFGIPEGGSAAEVVVLPGEAHALSRDPAAIAGVVEPWLRLVLGEALPGARR